MVGEFVQHVMEKGSGPGGSLGISSHNGAGGEDLGGHRPVDLKVTRRSGNDHSHGKMPLGIIKVETFFNENVEMDDFVESL